MKDDDECYLKLGVALHYIQDMWTLRPRIDKEHTKWEIEINSVQFLEDDELIEKINLEVLPTKAKKAYIKFIKVLRLGLNNPEFMEYSSYENSFLGISGSKAQYYALQERPSTYSSPIIDFNIAFRISLEVAKKGLSKAESGYYFNYGEVKTAKQKEAELATQKLREAPENRIIELDSIEFKEKDDLELEKEKKVIEQENMPFIVFTAAISFVTSGSVFGNLSYTTSLPFWVSWIVGILYAIFFVLSNNFLRKKGVPLLVRIILFYFIIGIQWWLASYFLDLYLSEF